jgi:tRNA dimethylallyltransferase
VQSPNVQGPRSAAWSIFSVLRVHPTIYAKRIDARVDAMFARGLVDETRELLKRGLEQNKTAMQAIGYRQVVEHLRGERSLKETIELVKIRTRRFAKRQLTWFRAQKNLEWIELKPDESLEKWPLEISRLIRKQN